MIDTKAVQVGEGPTYWLPVEGGFKEVTRCLNHELFGSEGSCLSFFIPTDKAFGRFSVMCEPCAHEDLRADHMERLAEDPDAKWLCDCTKDQIGSSCSYNGMYEVL